NGFAVSSNASEAVPCGTSITSKWVSWDTSAPTVGCGGIHGPGGTSASISQKLTADPLAGDTGVANAISHLTGVSSLTSPSGPSVSGGGDVDFAYSVASTQ